MKRRALSFVLALSFTTAACEKIVGIHGSHLRDGGADAAGGAPPDGGAGADGGAGTGGAAGTLDAGPSHDAATDAVEGGDATPPKDAAPEVTPPPACPASAPQVVQMFESNSGPHGTDKSPVACGYPLSFLPATGRYYAAAPAALYGGGTACGACLLVSDLQGISSVEVQVIDFSGGTAMNLDRDAYRMIDPTGSNPMVKARFVPCDYGGTIKAQFRGNNDPAVLVYDFSTRPTSIDILAPGNATWTALRHASTYWEPPSGYVPGGAMAKLRLTDELGAVVETGYLPIDGVFHDTGVRFPACAR